MTRCESSEPSDREYIDVSPPARWVDVVLLRIFAEHDDGIR
ncbi:hypothetical protein ACIQGM_21435 [Pseudarthrobacter sp. NPDC092200]